MIRIQHEPAFIIHRYDFSESSLILETFTRHHGRIALVAKGAKKPSSNFRPVLLPLQPLSLNYGGDAEVRTLKGAEWLGGHTMPTGDALLSGYYVNELLMRLLARDDPHPLLFDAYRTLVHIMAGAQYATQATHPDPAQADVAQLALRAFEWVLLREIGLLSDLSKDAASLNPLQTEKRYRLTPEGGLRATLGDEPGLPGAAWANLEDALLGGNLTGCMRACEQHAPAMKPMLRGLLHYHCQIPVLRTRQLLMDVRAL